MSFSTASRSRWQSIISAVYVSNILKLATASLHCLVRQMVVLLYGTLIAFENGFAKVTAHRALFVEEKSSLQGLSPGWAHHPR
jgi:hypothetical protein